MPRSGAAKMSPTKARRNARAVCGAMGLYSLNEMRGSDAVQIADEGHESDQEARGRQELREHAPFAAGKGICECDEPHEGEAY